MGPDRRVLLHRRSPRIVKTESARTYRNSKSLISEIISEGLGVSEVICLK